MRSIPTVFVIDSDEAIGEALTLLLDTYGIRVRTFLSAESFLESWDEGKATIGCLLVEANLPGASGLSIIRQLRAKHFNLPIFLMTNTANTDRRRQAIRCGATDVFEKPLLSSSLVDRITQLFSDSG